MDPRECQRDLTRLLNETRDCGNQLLECLNRENEALRTGDGAALEKAISSKIEHLQKLESLEKERVTLTRSAGYGADRDGMNACANWCDPDGKLGKLWNEMLAIMHECQTSNRANGNVVEISRRHVRRALEILRGQPSEVELYQPGGQTEEASLAGKSLGKA